MTDEKKQKKEQPRAPVKPQGPPARSINESDETVKDRRPKNS